MAKKNSPPSANAEDVGFENETRKKNWQQWDSNPGSSFCCPPLYPLLYRAFYAEVKQQSVYIKQSKNYFQIREKNHEIRFLGNTDELGKIWSPCDQYFSQK